MAENYTEKYKEELFYAWYETGDKSFGTSLLDKIPANENGSKPNLISIKKWADENGWIERADALDAQISLKQDAVVIDKRIEMYKRHAEIGEFEVEAGYQYLKEKGIKKEETALRAIVDGTELQRKSVGVEEVLRKIASMTPDQLDNELRKMLGQAKEEEFIIDGETKDVEPKE